MSKASLITLLALAVSVSLAGCSKETPAPAATAPAATASPQASMPESAPHPMTAQPDVKVDLAGIAKAEGGKTVAELFAEKDQLAGQPVVVRGKIVKTNAGIMGKNWLHVQDGSGAEGSNDLTVTTVDILPNVGDTVVVTGPVVLNKDFGMGYQYPVIIEDAEVKIEAAAGPQT